MENLTPESISGFYADVYEGVYNKAVEMAERDFDRQHPNFDPLGPERRIPRDEDVKFHLSVLLALMGTLSFDVDIDIEDVAGAGGN